MAHRLLAVAMLATVVVARAGALYGNDDGGNLPSISVSKEAKARVLAPSSEESAEEFKSADGRITVRGVWKGRGIELTKARLLAFASVYNVSRKNRFGGHDAEFVEKNEGRRLIEVQIRVDVPKGARAVDVSRLALVDEEKKVYRFRGLDVRSRLEPSSDFTLPHSGLGVLELKGEAEESMFFPIADTEVGNGTIAYMSDEGSKNPLHVRLLFDIPESQKTISIQAVDLPSANQRGENSTK